jgi:hypothetical protein
MVFGPDRETLFDLEVNRGLIGLVEIAESSKRRPFAAMDLRRGAELAVQPQLAIVDADAKLVLIRVEELDAAAPAFGERQTMPSLLDRPVLGGSR